MIMVKKQRCDQEVWKEIEENMKNPEYVKAAYEFIIKSMA
jgi:hypothetical protein